MNETECYSPVADQWTLLTLSPFDLCQFGLAVHQGQLYIVGGGSLHRRTKEDGIFICNPIERVWEKSGSLPKALVDHACCFVQLAHWAARAEQQREARAPVASKKKSTLSLFITNKYPSQPPLEKEREKGSRAKIQQ